MATVLPSFDQHPLLADAELDWSIYSEQIQLADPTGVRARGLANYKRFFQLVRLFRSLAV